MPDKNQTTKAKDSDKSPVKQSKAGSAQADKSSKKLNKNLLAVVVSILAVVALVVGLVYFFSVRQAPENIVMSAVVKTAETKNLQTSGTIDTKLEQFNGQLSLAFTSAKADQNSSVDAKITYQSDNIKKPVKVNGQAVLGADGTVYLRADNVSGLVATAFKEMGSMYERVQMQGSTAQPFALNKIIVNASEYLNDKWIKLPPAPADQDGSLNLLSCAQGVVAKYNANSSERRALMKAYKDNDFLLVDTKALKDKGSSDGYRVSFDQDKFKSFDQAVKKTTLGKMLTDCMADDSSLLENQDATLDGHIDLWINKFNHQITHASLDNPEATRLAIELDYGVDTKVSIPSEAKTITDIFSKPNLEAEAKKK